jgi:hypothetical protein
MTSKENPANFGSEKLSTGPSSGTTPIPKPYPRDVVSKILMAGIVLNIN